MWFSSRFQTFMIKFNLELAKVKFRTIHIFTITIIYKPHYKLRACQLDCRILYSVKNVWSSITYRWITMILGTGKTIRHPVLMGFVVLALSAN